MNGNMQNRQSVIKRAMGWMAAPVMRAMMKTPVHELLLMLDHTEEIEYTCDDAHEVLDLYAEMVQRGEDATALMPLVKRHLELCSNCREEFEALLAALEAVHA